MLRALGLGLLFVAGIAGGALAQGSTSFDGQYVGELVLTKTLSGDCSQPPLGSLYPLRISGGEVSFLYTPRFSTTLRGTVNDRGAFKASARIKSGIVQMTGAIHGNDVTAYIVSPSCNYTFQTKN